MADFGNLGKITVRNNRRAEIVEVNITNGEYLYFRVSVQGAEPLFSFDCSHERGFLSASDFPDHPKQQYEWMWGKKSSDVDDKDDLYAFGIVFTAAIKYSLLVEHRRRNNGVIKILKDVDFESQDPTDSFFEILRIFTS